MTPLKRSARWLKKKSGLAEIAMRLIAVQTEIKECQSETRQLGADFVSRLDAIQHSIDRSTQAMLELQSASASVRGYRYMSPYQPLKARHSTFEKYRDPNRAIGSQSETPLLKRTGNEIEVTGYQSYRLTGQMVDTSSLSPKYELLLQLLTSIRSQSPHLTSLLDIGCSSGLAMHLAQSCGFRVLDGIDHDVDYVEVGRATFSDLNVSATFHCGPWDTPVKPADVSLMLALIHWIFSATADTGDFETIFTHLHNVTKEILIIEWVEPNDPAIRQLGHLSINSENAFQNYSLHDFLSAGNDFFGSLVGLLPISSTRYLVVFSKGVRTHGYSSVVTVSGGVVRKTYKLQRILSDPDCIQREIEALNRLADFEWAPKLLATSENSLLLTYSGEGLTSLNAPSDISEQSQGILKDLESVGINHNDINPRNLCILDGKLKLIDFSWATFDGGSKPWLPDAIGVGDGVRHPGTPISDASMMTESIEILK